MTDQALLRRTLRRAGTSLALILVAVLVAPQARAEGGVLVIDLDRAVFETEDGLRIQALLRQLSEIRERELEATFRKLQADQAQLQKDVTSSKISDVEAQKRFEALQRQAAQLQVAKTALEDELDRTREQLARPIFDRVRGIVSRLATERGQTMVLDRSPSPRLARGAVAWLKADLELTDRVISIYNGTAAARPAVAPPPPSKR